MDEFVGKTQRVLCENKIGVIRIEELGKKLKQIMLTVVEDLDRSDLLELDYETYIYDEGFIFPCFNILPTGLGESRR